MDLTYYVIVAVFGMCSVVLRPCHSLPTTAAADPTPRPLSSQVAAAEPAADSKRSRSLFQSPHQYHHVHGLYDDAMMVDDYPQPPPPPPAVYYQQQQQQQQQEFQERILQMEDDLRAGEDNSVDSEAQDPRLSSRARPTKPDSPVYFIRLPPQPYMFVPGYGYVSQPTRLEPPPFTQRPHSPFLNLPINFMSNGKPVGVYTLPQQHQQNQNQQYQQQYQNQHQQQQQFHGRPKPHRRPQPTTTTQPPPPPPQQQPDSPIYNLDKGPYVFNGRPSDVFLLQSAYDNLYSEVLQNIYP